MAEARPSLGESHVALKCASARALEIQRHPFHFGGYLSSSIDTIIACWTKASSPRSPKSDAKFQASLAPYSNPPATARVGRVGEA